MQHQLAAQTAIIEQLQTEVAKAAHAEQHPEEDEELRNVASQVSHLSIAIVRVLCFLSCNSVEC
jgi:hypothetical protein